jgi:hypothetical protein
VSCLQLVNFEQFLKVAGQKNVEKRKPCMSPVRVAEVRRLVQSPVDRRHTHLSVRDIAHSMRARRDQHDRPTFGPIRRSTVGRIIKKALLLKPLTRQSVHALNDRQQAARLVACRRWQQVRGPDTHRLVHSDEKVSHCHATSAVKHTHSNSGVENDATKFTQ